MFSFRRASPKPADQPESPKRPFGPSGGAPDFSLPPVEAAGLVKRFPGPSGRLFEAAASLSFSLARPGALVCLTGPDGAGKTTLLRLLAGILHPDEGSARIFGLAPDTDNPAFVQLIGFMPQRFGLYEDLTVIENARLFGALKGVAGQALEKRFAELLALTGLAGFESRRAGQLSGGMKQKLGLACSLLAAPKLLILDEPTVGVDPLSRRELWRIIRRMQAESGMTALVSTAYLSEAAEADDVLLLSEGRLIAHEAPGALAALAEGLAWSAPLAAPGRAAPAAAAQLRKRAYMRAVRAESADAPFLDAVPRGGRADVLFPAGGAPAASPLGDALVPRAPTLEDAYSLLTFPTAPAERRAADDARFGAEAPDAARAAGARERPSIITARCISRRFGSFTAVADTSFDVREGEIFGLLGPNGAGKTTTFRMLCGLLPPSSGEIRVAGADLRTAKSAARARVGYVAQKFSLYERLTVRENLAYFGESFGVRGRALSERIEALAAGTELEKSLERRTAELPLGAKRELAMACALIHRPAILFLDEATSGADLCARRAFWRRIVALAEAGTTIVVTTHFMEEAEYCDRFLIQDAGRVLVLGSPEEVRRLAGADSVEEAFVRIVTESRSRAGGGS